MRQCRVIPEYLARLIKLRGTIAFESARMVTKTVPGTNARRLYEETFVDRVAMFLEKVSDGAKFDVARIKKGIRLTLKKPKIGMRCSISYIKPRC